METTLMTKTTIGPLVQSRPIPHFVASILLGPLQRFPVQRLQLPDGSVPSASHPLLCLKNGPTSPIPLERRGVTPTMKRLFSRIRFTSDNGIAASMIGVSERLFFGWLVPEEFRMEDAHALQSTVVSKRW